MELPTEVIGLEAEIPVVEQDTPFALCQFCRQNDPPENPTYVIAFPCGHQVHGYCFFSTRFTDFCDVCNAHIWNLRGYDRDETADERDERKRAETLVLENEEFQTELVNLKAACTAYSAAGRAHSKDTTVLRREYRGQIQPHVEAIRSYRKQILIKYKALPSVKLFRSRQAAVSRRFALITRKFRVSSHALFHLRNKRAHGKRLDFLQFYRWGIHRARRRMGVQNSVYAWRVRV